VEASSSVESRESSSFARALQDGSDGAAFLNMELDDMLAVARARVGSDFD
jgi:hypothetical protein